MARTRLLSRLQRLAADFHEAERTGKTVDEVQGERRGLNRRDFIKFTGAAVGAFAVSGTVPAFAQQTPRIGIIGAGISGLNAALTLSDAGYGATIYEASNRVGGRMHSDTTSWLNGQTTEFGGELIDTGHRTIRRLARRFNLPLTDLLAAEPAGSTETYFFDGSYYSAAQASEDFKPVFKALKADNNAAPFPTLYNSFTQAGFDLDQMSVRDWINSRVPGGFGSNMGQLLDVAYNIEYGNVSTQQSSLNLVYLLFNPPLASNGFSTFGASDERFHITGGNQQLPQAIASSLGSGAVKLSHRMTGIVHNNNDDTFTLTFDAPGGTLTRTFDRVIIAIPFSVLRKILTSNSDFRAAGFDTLKQKAITELGYGKNAKLHLQFDNRLWNQSGPWGLSNGTNYSDTGAQSGWDVSRGQSGATGILVDYTGGGVPLATFQGDPNDPNVVQGFARTYLNQINQVFPGIKQRWNGRATLSVPRIDPNLLGSYSYWKVGQYTSFSGYEGVRQPDPNTGKCHFAGEHCSTDFQGFMEGAAEEGARAANEILSDYNAGVFP